MSISDELERLRRLQDEGALSAEEFEQSKRIVLAANRSEPSKELSQKKRTRNRKAYQKSISSMTRSVWDIFVDIWWILFVSIYLLFRRPDLCSDPWKYVVVLLVLVGLAAAMR